MLRMAEIGWQLTLMYTNWVVMSAGTESFHPLFPLDHEQLVNLRKVIQSETDPDTRDFHESHLQKILKKRREYEQNYYRASGKESTFRKDFERGKTLIKHSVV